MVENKEILRSISETTIYTIEQVEEVFRDLKSYDETIMCLEIAQGSGRSTAWVIGKVYDLGISIKDMYELFIGKE